MTDTDQPKFSHLLPQETLAALYAHSKHVTSDKRVYAGDASAPFVFPSDHKVLRSLDFFNIRPNDPVLLRGMSMAGSRVEHLNISEHHLEEIRFHQANLTDLNISKCSLCEVDFAGARLDGRMHRSRLEDCDFRSANLQLTRFTACHFAYCNFTGADLDGTVFSACTFEACDGILYAHIAWSDHGETGRGLSAVSTDTANSLPPQAVQYSAGCFSGTYQQLILWITRQRNVDRIEYGIDIEDAERRYQTRLRTAKMVNELMADQRQAHGLAPDPGSIQTDDFVIAISKAQEER